MNIAWWHRFSARTSPRSPKGPQTATPAPISGPSACHHKEARHNKIVHRLALNLGERFGDFRFLIHDRGPDFARSFDAVFQAASARILRTAVQGTADERDLRAPDRHPAP